MFIAQKYNLKFKKITWFYRINGEGDGKPPALTLILSASKEILQIRVFGEINFNFYYLTPEPGYLILYNRVQCFL